MARQPLSVAGLVILVAVAVTEPTAHAAPRQGSAGNRQGARANTWTARSSTGLTLTGTWTAAADAKAGTATGTWTLLDPQGRTVVARGAWSANKSPRGWTGAWRAAVSGRNAEYSGTWSADVDLEKGASLADLFEKAARAAVSGSWRAGGQSGAWSIRTVEGQRGQAA